MSDVATDIRQYLTKHQGAADTLEGITRWWLSRQRYENALTQVEAALDEMIEQGLLRKLNSVDGKTIYRLREK